MCIAQYYNSQDMEVTKKSTDRWVDKEELLHVQMEYSLVKKKEKKKEDMPKAQYKELLATGKFKFKKVSAHTNHDHQHKVYKL